MMSNIYKIQILDGLRKNKLQILFILLFVLLARVSVIGLPFILKFIVDEIPKYQLEAFSGELTYLPFLAIGYACLFLTTTLLDEAKEYFSEKLIQPIVATIGARAFNKLIKWACHVTEARSNVLLARRTQEIDGARKKQSYGTSYSERRCLSGFPT